MFTLCRTVRFSVNPPGAGGGNRGSNGFAGAPAMTGLGRHYELEVECRGPIDPRTAYLVDIKDVDAAVRDGALPPIAEACAAGGATDPVTLVPLLLRRISDRLGASVSMIRWRLTPTYAVTMEAAMDSTALISQRFDLAAAHRLHSPRLTDEENRRCYGRCNNPSGHGHNYVFEPVIAVDLSDDRRPGLAEIERLVHAVLVERFDHKHLNLDTEEFGPGGVIPSVENIARVFFDRLGPAVRETFPRAILRRMTVWETDRTCATYPA